jgi:rhodanese-related sulfurtransferase
MRKVDIEVLGTLDPVASMSSHRIKELADLCFVERARAGTELFSAHGAAGQSVYLLDGEIELVMSDGKSRRIEGGKTEARHPLGKGGGVQAKALTDVELVRIDDDLLDIMATWDQLAAVTSPEVQPGAAEHQAVANWSILSGMFSVSNLQFGAFSQLPSANIEELLKRFKRVEADRGQVIIREGAEGDYYYVVEAGRCTVERMIGGVAVQLAELKSGDAFGEEALVSEAKRNATVVMKTDGILLRLDKKDFVQLLREPLLQRISREDARQKVENGAQWLDVRYPSEFQFDRLPGAMNVPLSSIRNAFGVLDKDREYVVYCQSERRSSAATFLLAQQGYKAFLLSGGLWGTS